MTRANAQPGCRHHVGTLAGFKSERVAGFRLECMAGFVGIRTATLLGCIKRVCQAARGAPVFSLPLCHSARSFFIQFEKED